jgi:DNA helicase-2/ATP-dependent DNA helicase PcrA
LDVLELWLEAGENPGQAQIEDVDTISLMTVHAAKGLEFDAVFVGSLVAGRFPTYNRRDPIEVPEKLIKETLPEGDEHLQEERRLFYVALTRAKRFLYLSFAEDLGGLKKRKMSGFLAETGFKPEKITVDTLQLSLLHAKEPPYLRHLKSGDYIIDHVSFSQIDTFKLCPLKYKYRYLLQIPARPHHSLSFGRTIHQTLHQFHQLEMQGKKLKVEELLDIYQKNFIDEGYDSQEHKQKRFDSGRKALQDYYQKHQELLGKPQLLERKFTLNLNGTKLIGKIDRIDKTKDGQLELVDYKTGSRKDQKAVDKDDQLTIYSLAAREALNLKIERMSLYFLEGGGDKVTTTRSPEDLTKARQKLIRQINQIKTSDFPAKPNPVVCGFCEYVELCPFAAKPKN